jgi:hypothetical protein
MNNQNIIILGKLSSDKDIKIITNNTFNSNNNILINTIKISDNISNSKLETLDILDSLTVNGDSNIKTLTVDGKITCDTLNTKKINNAIYNSFSSGNLFIGSGTINTIQIDTSRISTLNSVNNTITNLIGPNDSNIRIDKCEITNSIKATDIPFTDKITITDITNIGTSTISNIQTNNGVINYLNSTSSNYNSLSIKNSNNTSFFSQNGFISSLCTQNGNIKYSLNINNYSMSSLYTNIGTINKLYINTYSMSSLYTDSVTIANKINCDNLTISSLYTNNGTIGNLSSTESILSLYTNNNGTISTLNTYNYSSSSLYISNNGTLANVNMVDLNNVDRPIENLYITSTNVSNMSTANFYNNNYSTDSLFTRDKGTFDLLNNNRCTTNNINIIMPSNNPPLTLYNRGINIKTNPNNNALQIVNNNGTCSLFNGNVNNNNFMGIGYNMTPPQYTTSALNTTNTPILNTSSLILTSNDIILSGNSVSFNATNFQLTNGIVPIFTLSETYEFSRIQSFTIPDYNKNYLYFIFMMDNVAKSGTLFGRYGLLYYYFAEFLIDKTPKMDKIINGQNTTYTIATRYGLTLTKSSNNNIINVSRTNYSLIIKISVYRIM